MKEKGIDKYATQQQTMSIKYKNNNKTTRVLEKSGPRTFDFKNIQQIVYLSI